MFSSHLPPLQSSPRNFLMLGAGVLLIVGLLAGIAAVAQGEVRKAKLRDTVLVSQRVAVAQCVETTRGAELNACIIQARANTGNDGYRAGTTVADNGPAPFSRQAAAGSTAGQGFIPVSFNARR
jgi:hypothetical protein